MDLTNDIPRVRALLPADSQMILTHMDAEVAGTQPLSGIMIAEDQKTYTF
jgi:hypothetical protein